MIAIKMSEPPSEEKAPSTRDSCILRMKGKPPKWMSIGYWPIRISLKKIRKMSMIPSRPRPKLKYKLPLKKQRKMPKRLKKMPENEFYCI